MQRKRENFKSPDLTIWRWGAFFSFFPILLGALFEINKGTNLLEFIFVNPDIVYFCVSISLVAYGDVVKAVCVEKAGDVQEVKLLFLHLAILMISSVYYALFDSIIKELQLSIGYWLVIITNCMFVICVIIACVNTYKLKNTPKLS